MVVVAVVVAVVVVVYRERPSSAIGIKSRTTYGTHRYFGTLRLLLSFFWLISLTPGRTCQGHIPNIRIWESDSIGKKSCTNC